MPGPGYSTEDPNQQIARPGGGRPHAILVVLCRVKTDRPRADHGRNIETKPEYRVYLFLKAISKLKRNFLFLFCLELRGYFAASKEAREALLEHGRAASGGCSQGRARAPSGGAEAASTSIKTDHLR